MSLLVNALILNLKVEDGEVWAKLKDDCWRSGGDLPPSLAAVLGERLKTSRREAAGLPQGLEPHERYQGT